MVERKHMQPHGSAELQDDSESQKTYLDAMTSLETGVRQQKVSLKANSTPAPPPHQVPERRVRPSWAPHKSARNHSWTLTASVLANSTSSPCATPAFETDSLQSWASTRWWLELKLARHVYPGLAQPLVSRE